MNANPFAIAWLSDSQCEDYHFKCKEDGYCIAYYYTCDGFPECDDKSDEALDWCRE